MQELVDTDSETECRIESVQEKILQEFKIMSTKFISDTNEVETENNNLAKLDTNTKRNKNLSVYKLAHQVNKLISELLEKATNQRKRAKKKFTAKENKNMKQTYNPASAFATIMSSVLQKVDIFEDYEEMNDAILEKINTTTLENAKGRSKENTDGGDGESSSNESHKPPPKKRCKPGISSLFKTTGEDSDDDDYNVFAGDDNDDDDDNDKNGDEKED